MYCLACTWVVEGRKSGNYLKSSYNKSELQIFIDDHIGDGCHYEIIQHEPWSGTIYL